MKVLNFTVEVEEPDEGSDAFTDVSAVVKLEGSEIFRLPVSFFSFYRYGDEAGIDAVVGWLKEKLK
jgi:hypothetical protein